MYASALAYNKSYIFNVVLPQHESEAYWEEIEQGVKKAMEVRRDFHIDVEFYYYERFNKEAFVDCYTKCLDSNPNGVVIVPNEIEITRDFTDQLHARQIPFVFSTLTCLTSSPCRSSVRTRSVVVILQQRCSC